MNTFRGSTALDILAERRAAQTSDQLSQSPSAASTDPVELTHAKEELAKLDWAILQLPPRLAQVIISRDLCGQSYSQIARDMGISISTVRVHHYRAMQRLQRILTSDEG